MASSHPALKALVDNTKAKCAVEGDGVRIVTLEELKRHDGSDDGDYGSGWIAVAGNVYDLESFFDGSHKHPGGLAILRKFLGTDATSTFMNFHYPRGSAVKMAPEMFVGVLESS